MHGSIFFEAKTEAALRPGEPSRPQGPAPLRTRPVGREGSEGSEGSKGSEGSEGEGGRLRRQYEKTFKTGLHPWENRQTAPAARGNALPLWWLRHHLPPATRWDNNPCLL